MRTIAIACLLCTLYCLTGDNTAVLAWGKKPLATIDGQEYFADDYITWWTYWRDSEKQKPEGAQPFIDWMLMVREAERMDLASLPEFKHKIKVFLAARTLMLLKNEEIDSKIKLTDADIKRAYDLDYAPRRLVGALEFPTTEEATKFTEQHSGKALSLEQLQLMADEKPQPSFVLQQPQWLRPINTPAAWRPLLDQSLAGELRGPLPFGEKTAMLYVAETKAADDEDFAKKKETIKTDLRKRGEQRLTEALVQALKTKYHVKLNEEVLEKINLSKDSANELNQVLIESDRSTVTVGYFLEQSRRETDITHRLPADRAGQTMMKRRLANTMIANSLISWEALDRHYEEREPLLPTYQFYRQNRLVAEIENRAPGDMQVSEAEIKTYYQTHLEEFKRPEMITGIMVEGNEPLIRKVWAESISGAELSKAAKDSGATIAVPPGVEVPLAHFSATAQEVLSSLKTGDMSQPFLDNGHSVVIKLNDRKAGAAAPLERVSNLIRGRIEAEKKAKRKQDLLDALKSRSTIIVNEDVWKKLVAEDL
ncbi:MAG: peptidylprolyl isomerase [Desulfobulbaceae bacterium]|nr:peptidylprolyl isomerase [Desulfobulbaceae bacterium]